MLSRIRPLILAAAMSAMVAACGNSDSSAESEPDTSDDTSGAEDAASDSESDEDEIAEYFADQTIEIVVGYDPGSSQDIEARLLADHLGRFIPGNPSFTTSYQPGASGLAAYEYVHGAPPDGLTLALSSSTAPVDQLMVDYMGETGPQLSFDINELEWVGSTGPVSNTIWTHSNSGITSVEDLTGRETVAGATRIGSSTYTYMVLLRDVMDVPMEFVLGYATGSEMSLALLRGEIELQAGNWSTFVNNAEGNTEGELIPLVSFVADPPAEDLEQLGLDPIPNIRELSDDPSLQSLMDGALLSQGWGRLIAAPPDTPEHIVNAIGDALGQLADDPEFIADRDSRGIGALEPLPGSEVSEMVATYQATPPETLQRVADLFSEE